MMEEFERIMEVTEDKNVFRQNLMSNLGAYALDHPSKTQVDYIKVFPDLLLKLRDHYADEHAALLRKIYDVITIQGHKEGENLAKDMLENMIKRFGYNEVSAKEAFVYLVQKRY